MKQPNVGEMGTIWTCVEFESKLAAVPGEAVLCTALLFEAAIRDAAMDVFAAALGLAAIVLLPEAADLAVSDGVPVGNGSALDSDCKDASRLPFADVGPTPPLSYEGRYGPSSPCSPAA